MADPSKRLVKPPGLADLKLPPGISLSVEFLYARDLNVDEGTVQRFHDDTHIRKLDKLWGWLFVGVLLVSRRADGSLWAFDGQHRKIVALRKDPDAVVLCVVYEGLTLQQEAEMFLAFNKGRKNVPAYDAYMVALTAMEEVALRMQAGARAAGLDLARSVSDKRIGAIQKVRQIVELDKAKSGLLTDTLEVASAAWGREKETWDGQVLLGIARTINRNPFLDKKALASKIRSVSPAQWKYRAQQVLQHSGGSSSRSYPLVGLFAEVYNAGRRNRANMIELGKKALKKKK